jgi:hypothetical protein
MHNTSTIYRFYTPFLDIENEKNNLTGVMKKIGKSLIFDWVNYNKKTVKQDKYYKITFTFSEEMWKIDFYYIEKLLKDQYYLPIFKCDIYLNNKFFSTNETKKRAILFLNNIFECFDWLTEKEYLIDTNNNLFYKDWFFSSKKYANYDFRDLEEIRKKFEKKGWVKMLEEFITKLQTWDFILTKDNSNKYHSFYWMLLYFLYLVYIMHLNIIKTSKTVKELEDLWDNIWNKWNIILMKKRLKYVVNLNLSTYKNYKEKLEIFFNLLK